MSERDIYRVLRLLNDVRAVQRAFKVGSPAPIVRRVARRAYGRLTGRLAAKLFG